jgi:MATE family, multidrug and toxin extrusion protein
MHASTLVLLITSPFNALLSYLLIHRTRLGFLGAPLSISLTFHLSFILLVAYTRWGPGSSQVAADNSNGPTSISDSAILSTTLDTSQNPAPTMGGESPACVKSPKTTLSIRETFAPAPVFAFLRLALPGILMVATEWWAFEIVALAAGRLGRLPLAAQGVVMTADQSRCSSP